MDSIVYGPYTMALICCESQLKSMERDAEGKLTGKKLVDKTDMIGTHAYGNRTYVDLDWHPKGHMESHHFEKPLRRLRKFHLKFHL